MIKSIDDVQPRLLAEQSRANKLPLCADVHADADQSAGTGIATGLAARIAVRPISRSAL